MRVKANAEIRDAAKRAGVPFWMIGQKMGVSEQTIVRWMRQELPAEKKQVMLKLIDGLADKEGEA